MALFNYATKEITLKIVYYGPGLSGKTTNLQHLHSSLDPARRGKLLSLSTEADRTLFFDFLPVELGKIKDFSIRFQLYTVPGQVRYNATRKLVLKGADAVVFVADSQRQVRQQNIESLQNMRENLLANNLDPDDIPIAFQYNKRDLDNIMSLEEMNKDLNARRAPYFEAIAINGTGVKETFEAVTKLLIRHIAGRHRVDIREPEAAVERAVQAPVEERPLPETAPVTSGGSGPSSLLEEVASTLRELKHGMERLSSSLDSREAINERLRRFESTIKGLDRAVSDAQSRQEELIGLLKDIKSSIDNAKTKKRWFLFG